MSARCYMCDKFLPDWFTFTLNAPMPDNAWHMKNVAPDAASGGVMMPVCKKCDPNPLGLLNIWGVPTD